MSLTDLIPEPYRLAAELVLGAAALAAAGICGGMVVHWKDGTQLANEKAAWAQERAALATQVQQQQARNIELQQAAEKKYVVNQQGQDHYFTQTITEIRHDAAPLAACPVPDAVRVRINAAIDCASADPAPTCGAVGEVPGPGKAAGRRDGQ